MGAGHLGVAFSDYDRDGDTDIYVLFSNIDLYISLDAKSIRVETSSRIGLDMQAHFLTHKTG